MRTTFLASSALLITFAHGFNTNAQASMQNAFSANLSLGSSGAQVLTLQKILNRSHDTRIASAGPGSPGNETEYFGSLTRAAVVRFQEKYTGEILAPAALTRGNGYVGSYTRAKLNALSVLANAINVSPAPATTPSASVPVAATSTAAAAPPADYRVTDAERIDIYAGDNMLADVQSKIYSAINSAVASQSATAIALPAISQADMPRVVIGTLSPQSGVPGTRVSVHGGGVSANSSVYFGSTYIVRTVHRDSSGNFSFIVPAIPPARYDVAIRTGESVSNTAMFVITDPRNSPVHIQSVSPSAIPYGGTLTITGSGFLPSGNIVVTSYQKITNVSSLDGKTLVIQPAPVSLQESSKIGDGTRNIPMFLYVVNEYGFSDSIKSFTMSL